MSRRDLTFFASLTITPALSEADRKLFNAITGETSLAAAREAARARIEGGGEPAKNGNNTPTFQLSAPSPEDLIREDPQKIVTAIAGQLEIRAKSTLDFEQVFPSVYDDGTEFSLEGEAGDECPEDIVEAFAEHFFKPLGYRLDGSFDYEEEEIGTTWVYVNNNRVETTMSESQGPSWAPKLPSELRQQLKTLVDGATPLSDARVSVGRQEFDALASLLQCSVDL